MSLPIYASRKVSVSWGGVTFQGFAPDSFVTFARNGDITDEEVGADGKLSISILPDRSGTSTISLQKESPTNIALASLLNRQVAGDYIVIADLNIHDPSGSSIATLKNCHVKTAPEIGFSSSATGTSYDWTFFSEEMWFLSSAELGDSDPIIKQEADSSLSIWAGLGVGIGFGFGFSSQ